MWPRGPISASMANNRQIPSASMMGSGQNPTDAPWKDEVHTGKSYHLTRSETLRGKGFVKTMKLKDIIIGNR